MKPLWSIFLSIRSSINFLGSHFLDLWIASLHQPHDVGDAGGIGVGFLVGAQDQVSITFFGVLLADLADIFAEFLECWVLLRRERKRRALDDRLQKIFRQLRIFLNVWFAHDKAGAQDRQLGLIQVRQGGKASAAKRPALHAVEHRRVDGAGASAWASTF